jgi:NADH dehydrogenase/NADH:ubiquinone oxidoreductase subunit G
MLDNKLYDFAIEYREISLLHFMHYLRMNQNYVITSMEIPRFCYHPLLSIAANCRMCLVEEIGAPKLIVSCANIIKPHASYFSMNVLIRNVREHILEYLLLNHPLDCPICDQGGECDLQDITKVYGLDNSRYFNKIKKAVVFKDFNNFFIKFKMTRCIHCTRCIRFFNEILDINLLGLINRGFSMKISYFTENLYQYKANAFGNVADICPVGALTLANTEDRIRA